MAEWIGTVGALSFAAAWIPQCVETVRTRRCDVTWGFLSLQALGSVSLATYAILRGDMVFSVINVMTTVAALLNLTVKFLARGVAAAQD